MILVDQLQSEQGARFLHKRNRNIIVEVEESDPIEILDGFIWLSLGQIKELISYPNVLNMDTRYGDFLYYFWKLFGTFLEIDESVASKESGNFR